MASIRASASCRRKVLRRKEVVIGLYDDGRVVDVPEGKKAFVMNASGKDSFIIRRGGKLSEVSCKSGDWIEL